MILAILGAGVLATWCLLGLLTVRATLAGYRRQLREARRVH